MRRQMMMVFFFFVLALAISPHQVVADKSDIILKKMVEKGLLSPDDADAIAREAEAEEKAKKEAIPKVATKDATVDADTGKITIPKWLLNTKFKGDIRLRYQTEDRDGNNRDRRDRTRFRLRAGFETAITDEWKGGFGIASGGSDPRSTNQTLQNTFDSPDVRIDMAYINYKPAKWLNLMGGKFKNPIWKPKDLLWDSDIRPEGIAAKFDFKVADSLTVFVTPGFFILDEFSADDDDPHMFVLQPGINWKITKMLNLKLAGAYYHFDNLEGNFFSEGSGSNTTSNGNLVFGYDAIAAGAELGINLPTPAVPYASVFGEYVTNIDSDDSFGALSNDDDTGYLVGLKFGHKKVKDKWQWQAKYNYRLLETDAWPDFFPDSDFYGGATNASGHEFEVVVGLAKNVTLGLDYYISELDETSGGDAEEEDVLQADLIVKW